MEFTKKPPTWENAGQEPSLELQQEGFKAGYKPPAPYFNFLFHQYTECIKELQEKGGVEYAPDGYGLGGMAKDITGQDIVQVTRGKSGFYQGRNVTNAPSSWFYYFFVNAGDDKTNIVAIGSAGKLYSTQFDNYVTTATWNEYVKASYGTVTSSNADFAEVGEWSDGNPDEEDRRNYFVTVSKTESGITMTKATADSDVRGVTISHPAFAANASDDKYDENGNLLPQYNYVAFAGFATVIDNGTCTVNGRCMPDDNGCAVPSNNSMGYQIIERVAKNKVLILVEPSADMLNRIKTDVENIENSLTASDNTNFKFDVDENGNYGYRKSDNSFSPFAVNDKQITGTLAAGETILTLTDDSLNYQSTVDIYTDIYGVSPKNVTVEDGQITLEFKALENSLDVKVVIK